MAIVGMSMALVVGLLLGLIGGGGSILTVPVLVYMLGIPAVQATAYSLFVVGLAALVGAIGYVRSGEVDARVATLFALPSLVAVFATRRFIIPAVPDRLFTVGTVVVTKDMAILVLFAVTMLLAAVSMIRGCRRCVTRSEDRERGNHQRLSVPAVLIEGLVVGTLTGLVGAGGGFLIIPALVLVAGLPMRQAVGTSLLIIAAKSLTGFLGDLGASTMIDWPVLLGFSAITVTGIILGVLISKQVAEKRLRPAFGWLVLVMGTAIIVQEIAGIAPAVQ